MREVVPGVHVVERPLRYVGVEIGTRMTAVRLASGGVWLHSPVAIDPELRRAIDALGRVEHLVAPNRMHHLYLSGWADAYPEARIWGPPRLARKRPDLSLAGTLDGAPPGEWGDEFEQHVIRGAPAFNEVALLHRPSRTLLLADHLFHIGREAPRITRIVMRLFGAYDRAAWPRDFGFIVRDRGALRRSIDTVLGWDFDRIVLCHGRIVENGGREILAGAYRWLG